MNQLWEDHKWLILLFALMWIATSGCVSRNDVAHLRTTTTLTQQGVK